jgi:hypothetical protein
LVGKTAAIDSSVIAGDALRLDAHNFMDPDEVHVLHTKGVTKFTMY